MRIAAAFIAVLVFACGDSEPAPETEKAAPTKAGPEEEEPELLDAPAPPPEEGNVLVSSGANPVAELAYTPTAGATRRLIATVRVNSRQGPKRAKLSPRVWFALDTVVQAAPGGWKRDFVVVAVDVVPERRVPDESETKLKAKIGALKGLLGAVTLDARGLATGYEAGPQQAADTDVAAIAAALKSALMYHMSPLPPGPVGKGGAWEVTTRRELHGLTLWQVLALKLAKRNKLQFEIAGTMALPQVDGEAIEGTPAGFAGVASVESFEGSGKYTARFDAKAAAPIETHLVLEGNFTGLGSDGSARSGKFGVDATVEEDFMSAPDARVKLRGKFVQGGLVHGTVPPKTKVWFNRKRLKVSPTGDFLLGFGRNAKRRALLAFTFPGSQAERHVVHIGGRVFEDEKIDGLPPEMVDLERSLKKELVKSRRRVDKARSKVSNKPYFAAGFKWPVRGKVTSTYGRKRILNGKEKGIHWGLDVAAPVGKKVRAPAAGVVVLADEGVPLSGNLLIVDHGYGLTSSFLHLKQFKVEVGQEVRRGQIIATVGSTGRSTGPHLDWRMNLGDLRIDPQLLVTR